MKTRTNARAPAAGEMFRQTDLLATLQKLVETEAGALAAGKTRKQAIYAAYDRFYRGDIADEIVRASTEYGGLITKEDLDKWQVHIEEPVTTNYKGVDVYKLTTWVQGPVLLQALNILEEIDLKSMGYNSARYIHTLYQAMNLSFADRDFYYGDPYVPPAEPVAGLLSKKYAAQRRALMDPNKNNPETRPGDPYPFQDEKNPFAEFLKNWSPIPPSAEAEGAEGFQQAMHMSEEERLPGRHHIHTGSGCRGLGGFDNAKWRVDSCLYRRFYRRWPESAYAEFCADRTDEPF